jgi:hypothetical protein
MTCVCRCFVKHFVLCKIIYMVGVARLVAAKRRNSEANGSKCTFRLIGGASVIVCGEPLKQQRKAVF